MRIVHVVAARPNFVKMAPVIEALGRYESVDQLIVHTGQHYDRSLSDDIMTDLAFLRPDRFLGVGGGTHAEQTGRTMIEFERVVLETRPALVVVAGDVNATLACALAATKEHVPVAHVESGLRSLDWSMPEEVNRVLTDRISDLLFTHSPEATTNLVDEGIDPDRIRYVGNTMVDSLFRVRAAAEALEAWVEFGAAKGEYVLVTLHRPSNVDDGAHLSAIVDELITLRRRTAVLVPLHPRTRSRLSASGDLAKLERGRVRCLDALGYLSFVSLESGAGAVLTDSGGVQEETSALGVPCYTLRSTTERPITITHGTNVLIGDSPEAIRLVDTFPSVAREPIPLWDGAAGARAAAHIVGFEPRTS